MILKRWHKKQLRRGNFQYDSRTNSTQGHFITAKLDLSKSKVIFIDSPNQDITKSSYFDFPQINEEHTSLKTKNGPVKTI